MTLLYRIMLILALLSSIPAVNAASPRSQQRATDESVWPRGDAGRTGRHPGPGPEGNPVLRWKHTGDEFGSTYPAVDAWSVKIGNGIANTLDAFDLATGRTDWRRETGRILAPPTTGAAKVFVPSVNGLWVLNPVNHRLSWRLANTTDYFGVDQSLLNVVPGLAIVSIGSQPQEWLGLDDETGAIHWRVWANADITPSAIPSAPSAAVAVVGDQIFIGATGGVLKLDAATGAEVGRFVGKGRNDLPSVSGTSLYVSTDTGISSVDSTSMEERWYVDMSGVTTAPTIGENTLYVGTDGAVVALDAETGQERWRHDLDPRGELALADGTLYVSGNDGLFALDPGSGETLWQFDGALGQIVAVIGGAVVVADIQTSTTYVVGGSDNPRGASPQPAPPTEVSLPGEAPPPSACTISPVDKDRVMALAERPISEETDVDEIVRAWRDGSPANAEDVTTVSAVERMRIACLNGGKHVRLMALMSDNQIRRLIGQSGFSKESLAATFNETPEIVAEDERTRLVEVHDGRMLSDGRLAVVVITAQPFINPALPEPGPMRTSIAVYARVNGTWLVDDRVMTSGAL